VAGQEGRDGEEAEAGQEEQLAAETVAEGAGRQEQAERLPAAVRGHGSLPDEIFSLMGVALYS
jgi:hypothetical protein